MFYVLLLDDSAFGQCHYLMDNQTQNHYRKALFPCYPLQFDIGSTGCGAVVCIPLPLPSLAPPRWLSKTSQREPAAADVARWACEIVHGKPKRLGK